MDEVRVKRDKLREKLEKNRASHHEQWQRAIEGFKRVVMETMRTNLAHFEAGRVQRVYISEAPPEEHTRDYDVALSMLDMSVDDEVTLSTERFRNLVLDDWKWKPAWIESTSKYLSGE